MTIYELLDSCVDAGLLKLTIYDIDSGKEVWSGDGDEIPTEYEDLECWSWDVPFKEREFTVNVCMEDNK